MGLNLVVVKLAHKELERFNGDSSLYDAIVTGDAELIKYLCNNKYKDELWRTGFVKEDFSIVKMIEGLDCLLGKSKGIRLIY